MSSTTLKHRYSFSGSDTKAYAYYRQSDNNGKMYHLEAMHTLSCSVFEAKGRVRSLGFKSIRGFTRAVREISGTMIMLVIEDHPLAPLMKANPFKGSNRYGGDKRSWSIDARETALGSTSFTRYGPQSDDFMETDYTRIPTTLPPFNIFVTFQSEIPIGSEVRNLSSTVVGHQTREDGTIIQKSRETVLNKTKYRRGGFEIQDVEILGEGIVTSVNDMVTEIQYQFVARDYKEFSLEEARSYIEKLERIKFENVQKSHEQELYLNLSNLVNPPSIVIGKDGTINLTNVVRNSSASPAAKQLLGNPNMMSRADGSNSQKTKEQEAVNYILEQKRLNDEKKAAFVKSTYYATISASSLAKTFSKQEASGESTLYKVYGPTNRNGQTSPGHDYYGEKIPGTNADIEYYTVHPPKFENGEYTFKVDFSNKSGSHTHERIIKNATGQISYADFLQ
jgi:hypothetical protein